MQIIFIERDINFKVSIIIKDWGMHVNKVNAGAGNNFSGASEI